MVNVVNDCSLVRFRHKNYLDRFIKKIMVWIQKVLGKSYLMCMMQVNYVTRDMNSGVLVDRLTNPPQPPPSAAF